MYYYHCFCSHCLFVSIIRKVRDEFYEILEIGYGTVNSLLDSGNNVDPCLRWIQDCFDIIQINYAVQRIIMTLTECVSLCIFNN